MYYTLDDNHNLVPTDDVLEWGMWFEKANRRVAKDTINGILVSTVFLGLDHSFDDGPPTVFETMVFDKLPSHHECYCERSATWDEALTQHQKACDWVRQGMPDQS